MGSAPGPATLRARAIDAARPSGLCSAIGAVRLSPQAVESARLAARLSGCAAAAAAAAAAVAVARLSLPERDCAVLQSRRLP